VDNLSAARAEIIANLPTLIRKAVRVESHDDSRSRSGVSNINRLYSPLRPDGGMNRVKMTVRELTDVGRVHYAVEFAEIDGAGGNTAAVQVEAQATYTTATPVPVIEIGDLLRDVNCQEGSPIIARSEEGGQFATGDDVDALRTRQTAALDARSRRIPGEGVQESQGRSEERLDSEDRTFATRETVGGITTDFTLTASFVEAASDLETLISGVIAGKGPGEKRLRLS